VLTVAAVWEKTGSFHRDRVVAVVGRQSAHLEEGDLHDRQTEIAVSDVGDYWNLCQKMRRWWWESWVAQCWILQATS
jgi:hypothetical protein